MLENVEVLCHSSIKINKEKVIYIDPFKIEKNYNDADIVFITHDHYDHYSEEDIDKVINENTIIIIPEELLTKLLRKGINKNAIITVEPNEKYIDIRYYIAGDTDITEENRKVKCDVAFVPVGGTYTIDFKEAAQLINEIQPKIAVPIHYGSVVGTKQDATDFIKLLNPSIKGIILMNNRRKEE